MNSFLSNDDELIRKLNEISLPDEDVAWTDMKKRLEENENRPGGNSRNATLSKRYRLLVLLMLITSVSVFFYLINVNQASKKESAPVVTSQVDTNRKSETQQQIPGDAASSKTQYESSVRVTDTSIASATFSDKVVTDEITSDKSLLPQDSGDSIQKKLPGKENIPTNQNSIDTKSKINKKGQLNGENSQNSEEVKLNKPNNLALKKSNKESSKKKAKESQSGQAGLNTKEPEISLNEKRGNEKESTTDSNSSSVDAARHNEIVPSEKKNQGIDSADIKDKSGLTSGGNKTDSLLKDLQKASPVTKKRKGRFSISVGATVWQKIDKIGKSAQANSVIIDSAGNTTLLKNDNKLLNYLPSIYAAIQAGNKWQFQVEARFRAPQYSGAELYYSKKGGAGVPDTLTSTSRTLKKTFVYQLPVLINYKVTPSWSVGAGITLNRFSSARIEELQTRKNMVTLRDSVIAFKELQLKQPDSSFSKSYMQLTFQTQYKWKRFSIGVNYSTGIQPFLTYKLTGQELIKKRNSSLNIFLRFEILKPH